MENFLLNNDSTFWGGVGTFVAAIGLTVYNVFRQKRLKIADSNHPPSSQCDKKCADHVLVLQQHTDKYADVDRRLSEGRERFGEIDHKLDRLQDCIVTVKNDVSFIKGRMEKLT